MSSQKRTASEAFLPVPRAKVPRTTMYRTETEPGVNASPRTEDGLLQKWSSLLKETVWTAMSWFLGEPTLPVYNTNTSLEHPPAPATPAPPTQQRLPPPQNSLFGVSVIARLPKPALNTAPTNLVASSSTSSFRPPPPHPKSSVSTSESFTHLSLAATATATPGSSLFGSPTGSCFPSDIHGPGELQDIQNSIVRRMIGSQNGVTSRSRRRHIYDRKHKKASREHLEKELYALKVKQGYQSSFEAFRGYLAYKNRVDEVQKRDEAAGVSSRSITPGAIPIIYPGDQSFLEKAISKAKKSLDSPRPPRPFSPTLEYLRERQKNIDERIKDRLHPKKKPLPDSLPPDVQKEVNTIKRKTGTISKAGKEQVSDRDIAMLGPGQWLNDEIINFYGQLILNRSSEAEAGKENNENGRKVLNVHYFSTFFWTKLLAGYEKSRLAKWTKKIDIFSKDVVLIPVNHNNLHWTAAAINFRKKRIESYDSMGSHRSNVYKLLRSYVDDEHRNKKKKPFDFSGWEDYEMDNAPQQENGFDCGVFTCQTLEALSRGEEEFNFSQKDMPYLRQRMIWEIGRAKLAEENS